MTCCRRSSFRKDVNFWDELYKVANKDENGAEIEYRYTGSEGSNISDPSFKYLRPYSVMKDNNPVYDGYTWAKANYLSPLPIREIELLSPDENCRNFCSLSKSVLADNDQRYCYRINER